MAFQYKNKGWCCRNKKLLTKSKVKLQKVFISLIPIFWKQETKVEVRRNDLCVIQSTYSLKHGPFSVNLVDGQLPIRTHSPLEVSFLN